MDPYLTNCLVIAGLSLYFEDGHDDLDDCKYADNTALKIAYYCRII